MSDIEEKPLHEVILDIMYFKNTDKPVPFSAEDIFWQIKDPNISERQITEVLDWLVVNKKAEKRFGKYQIDKYEFIDLSNKYKEDDTINDNVKDTETQTKVEVVKKVSVSKPRPPKRTRKKTIRKRLPKDVLNTIDEIVEETEGFEGPVLNLVLNYGGRSEIVESARKISCLYKNGEVSLEDINENLFSKNLFHKDIEDPELLIRTSGEYRLSNFILWQIAYTELWFTDTLWPDFKSEDLIKAVYDYQKRERRFGKTK